jgi:hypothetical protein
MSATANIFTAVGTSWAASAIGFVTYAIKTAKSEETKFAAYVAQLEAQFNNVLSEIQALETKLSELVPAPKPAPVAKAKVLTNKAPATKRLR